MTAIDPIWEFLAAGVPGWECVKKQREQQKHGGDDEMDWSGEEDGEVEDEGVEADDDDDDDDDNYYDDDYDCSDGERETVTERTPRYRPARPIIPMGYSIVNGRTESGKVEQWLIPKGGEVELQIAQHQQQQQQKRLHPKSRPLRIR